MAAPIIYTGKNYAQYTPNQGRALQAMSQFSQQQAMRQESDLQRSREDRNMFIQMMKMDPVYTATQNSQKRVSAFMEIFTDNVTAMNKKRGQNAMTTSDWAELSQIRGETMALMQREKAASDELVMAAKMAQADPGKWDLEEVNIRAKEWDKTGIKPLGGFLSPAVKDPVDEFLKEAVPRFGKYHWVPGETRPTENGGREQLFTKVYDSQTAAPEDEVIKTWATSGKLSQHNIQNTFDRLKKTNPQEYNQYMEQSGGNEQKAANMRFVNNAKGKLYAPYSEWRQRGPTASETRPGYPEREQEKTYLNEVTNTQYVDGNKAFSKEWISGGEIAGGGTQGIQFPPETKAMSLLADDLEFSESLPLKPGTRIRLKPTRAVNRKIEFGVDPSETGFVSIEVDEYSDMPRDISKNEHFTRKRDDNDNIIGYIYKARVPENITAIGSFEKYGSFVNNATEGTFLERYEEWFGGEDKPSPKDQWTDEEDEKARRK